MIKAHDANGEWVLATNALSGHQYFCPKCRESLIIIQGSTLRTDHFRHHRQSSCSFGADETPEHAEKKLDLYSGLQEALGNNNVRMEYRLDDGQCPDIYFEVEGQGVAVEIQHSPISSADLIDRTASYSDKRVASLWMPDNIKRFLNTTPTFEGTNLAHIPLWMRRIAGLTDNVAFDRYTDVTRSPNELVSIQLQLKSRTIRNAKGEWVNDLYWPTRTCLLHTGNVRDDRNDSGHRLMLWIPRPTAGEGLVSTRSKRQQFRREIIDTTGAPVDCIRTQLAIPGAGARQPIVTPTQYTATKTLLLAMYKEVYELNGDSGFLVKTADGSFLALEARGKPI